MKKIQISLAAALLLVCGITFAYTSQQKPAAVYIGLQLGYANTHYTEQWLISGTTNIRTVGDVQNSGLAGRFHVGYDFNQYFALEAGLTFLPKVEFNDINSTGVDVSFTQSIFDFCAKANLPLQYNIDLYGKAGFASVLRDDLEASAGNVRVETDYQDTKTVPALGAGMAYGFNDHVFVDLSYMHYFGKDDLQPIDFTGVGVVYRF